MWMELAIVVGILAIAVGAAVSTAKARHEIDLTRRFGDE